MRGRAPGFNASTMTRLHPISALLGLLLSGFVPCHATAQSAPVQQSRTLRVAGVERSYLLITPILVSVGAPCAARAGVPRGRRRSAADGASHRLHRARRAGGIRRGLPRRAPPPVERRARYRVERRRRLHQSTARHAGGAAQHRSPPHLRHRISNGAMFSYRLACDLPGVLAGIAPVAGAMPSALAERCAHAPSVALAAFQGSADPLVPYDGGGVALRRGQVLPAVGSVELWATIAGCGRRAHGHPRARPRHRRNPSAVERLERMQGWSRRRALYY